MKKGKEKLHILQFVVAVILAIVISISPITTQNAKAAIVVTYSTTMYTNDKMQIDLDYTQKNVKLKSSNTKIATISKTGWIKTKNKTGKVVITVKYPKGTDRYNITVKKDKYAITINKAGVSAGMQAVVATVKKTGNVTVSYKKQGTVNKQTFVVKKYTNPLKSLKIDGTNIASKFKTDNVYVLPYAKYAGKKIKVSYSAASNFELLYVDYLLQPGNMKSDIVKNKGTVKIQKKNSALLISAYNAKTQQNETCMVIFQ